MKKKIERKIILYSLPICIPPVLFMFIAIFALSGGTEPISPPTTEDKAIEYQKICSAVGVPWDIVLLTDAQRAERDKKSGIEDYNPLESALEFLILEEQQFTVTEETIEDEEGNEQIVESRKFTQSEEYVGRDEILLYLGMDIQNLSADSLYKEASEIADSKSTGDICYEALFHVQNSIEHVLNTIFQFTDEEIQDIMDLHNSKYLILLYNGSDSFNIGNVQIGDFTEVELTVWDFLKQIGFNDIGCAAVMGNMKVESSFNVAANHNDHYFGLCQWGGGRWQGNAISLTSYACQVGTEWYDLGTQLNFFNLECSQSYNDVYMQMRNATEIIYATDYFCAKYEICIGTLGNWAYSVIDGKPYQCLVDRRAYAQAYYEKYANVA